METTLLLIKPDAVGRNLIGRILARVEAKGLAVRRLKLVKLTPAEAGEFYRTHAGEPFYEALLEFMASGPICAVVLEAEDAIGRLRRLAGATDPAAAEEGTIRRIFGLDGRRNSVHASDSPASAAEEIAFFGLTLDRERPAGGGS